MRMIFLFLLFLLTFAVTTNAQICDGYIKLSINPKFAPPSSYVEVFADGLSGCSGKIVYFKQDSCFGSQLASCVIDGGNSCSSVFALPSISGAYNYFACVDKNADNDFTDLGESYSLIYTVGYSSLPEFGLEGIIQIIILSLVVLLIRK